jgi:hypothetical protein
VAAVALAGAVAAPAAGAAAFVPGSGTSSAGFARIQMRSSGAAIGFGLGVARTRYAGAQGNAEAASVDLGLFETLKKVPLACGYSMGALFPPGVPPAGVAVSSADGATEQQTASAGEGGPLQFGRQYGAAAPGTSADAAVDGMNLKLPGVLEALGGSASSRARLVPGEERISSADSALGSLSLGGGVVQLAGLRWIAGDSSGSTSIAQAGFSIGSVTVGGHVLPSAGPEQFAAALAAANTALAATGLILSPPEVTRDAGGASVGPLRLSVTATPTLRAVLDPALSALQPLRSQLLALAGPLQASPDCGLAKALGFGYLGLDLATLVLGEGGALDLDFGGARAGTDGTAYADPFASGFGLLPPALPARTTVPPLAATGPGAAAAPPVIVDAPVAAAPPPAGPSPPVLVRPVSQALAAMSCRSTHPSGGGCSVRRGQLAAWLALTLIAVLAAADRLRAWRS